MAIDWILAEKVVEADKQPEQVAATQNVLLAQTQEFYPKMGIIETP